MSIFFTPLRRLIFLVCLFSTTANVSYSQDLLYGLTTNGGPGGKGNVFSVQTTGADFRVLRAFTSLGANPKGSLIKGSDGNFYGMMQLGGKYNHGSIFKMTAGGVVTILRHLNGPDGVRPLGGLTEGFDKNFYGMTKLGGQYNFGTIFRITPSGAFTVLYSFNGSGGKYPEGGLLLGDDNRLYGMARYGGSSRNDGTIFSIGTTGGFRILRVFERSGTANSAAQPVGTLVKGADGFLYGMTLLGGNNFAQEYNEDYGMIFKINPQTGQYIEIRDLYSGWTTIGYSPTGSFIKTADNNLYAIMAKGGAQGGGTIIKLSTTGVISVLGSLSFSGVGGKSTAELCDGADGYLYGSTSIGGTYGQGTLFRFSLSTRQFSLIRNTSNLNDGSKIFARFYRNSDGFFYGLASEGGHKIATPGITAGSGTIFKFNSAGTFAIVSQLPDATLGMVPRESVSLGRDGNYYGTTEEGGTYGVGTIFKISATGTFTKLRSLNPTTNGANPKDGPIHASDGNLYGTTSKGGAYGHGTIYKITTAGVISTFYSFNGNLGSNPHCKLMQASDGYLYGVTRNGGSNNHGTLFRISLSGTYTVLRHLLASQDGGQPEGNLYQASAGGTIWGTATIGGLNGNGTIFKLTGTTFSVVKHLTTAQGRIPSGNLFLASNGVYYGTTNAGGAYGYGTIFRITGSTGYFIVVHNFQGGVSGGRPYGGLVEDGNKILYGTASVGGSYGGGVIFKFALTNTYSVIKHLEPGVTGTVPKGNLVLKRATATSSASLLDPNSAVSSQARMLFPNPAKDYVILQSDELQNDFSLQLINMSGQVVRTIENPKSINKTSLQVDVSADAPGLYMLLLQSTNKKELYRFVKY